MNKAVNEKDWRDVVNEHINSLNDRMADNDDKRKELFSAVQLLSESNRALWDTIDLMRSHINKLEAGNRNTKRRIWKWF